MSVSPNSLLLFIYLFSLIRYYFKLILVLLRYTWLLRIFKYSINSSTLRLQFRILSSSRISFLEIIIFSIVFPLNVQFSSNSQRIPSLPPKFTHLSTIFSTLSADQRDPRAFYEISNGVRVDEMRAFEVARKRGESVKEVASRIIRENGGAEEIWGRDRAWRVRGLRVGGGGGGNFPSKNIPSFLERIRNPLIQHGIKVVGRSRI